MCWKWIKYCILQTFPFLMSTSRKGLFRGRICQCRHCRRQYKIFVSGVNFSIFTHFFVFLSLKLLKLGEIDWCKIFAWKSGGVNFLTNSMSVSTIYWSEFIKIIPLLDYSLVKIIYYITPFGLYVGQNWSLLYNFWTIYILVRNNHQYKTHITFFSLFSSSSHLSWTGSLWRT